MRPRVLNWLVALSSLLAILGCGQTEPTAADVPPLNPNAMGAPSGNAVFDKKCANCHSVTSPTMGGPKRKGPNLSKVGSERSVEWLADHVKNPQSHEPGSKMPEFASKL